MDPTSLKYTHDECPEKRRENVTVKRSGVSSFPEPVRSTASVFPGTPEYRYRVPLIGNHALRSGTEETAASKIFIEFVALIIRNRMYNYLRDAMKEMAKKPNYMTVLDGVYRLDHAATATQKTILKAFGLTDANVKYRVEEIGRKLETGI